MSYGLVALDSKELSDLATLLYRQETNIIRSRPFSSTNELNLYLEDCGIAYDYVAKIQKAAGYLDSKYWKKDPVKGPIAHNILDYEEKALNTGLQIVRNYSARKLYMQKLNDHINSYITALDKLDPQDTTAVNDLSNDVIKYRDCMANCMQNYYNSTDAFSQWVKNTGMTFQDLVERYETELGYQGNFKDLSDSQKLDVCESIITMFGKGNIFKTDFASKTGVGLLVLLAGMITWDVFSSKHVLEAARKAVDYLTYVGTAYLSEVVTNIAAAALAGTIGAVEIVAWAAGMIAGNLGAFLIGAFAGPLLEMFFGSGGAPLSTDGIKCQSAELPNGIAITNQIWSQHHHPQKRLNPSTSCIRFDPSCYFRYVCVLIYKYIYIYYL